jgi:TolB protein
LFTVVDGVDGSSSDGSSSDGSSSDGSSSDDMVKLYQNMGESPFYLYWSPDSRKISFLANHPMGIGLHIAQVDEETSRNDVVTVGQPLYWDWSPNGESMFVHTGVAGANGRLALMKADGTTEDELAEPGFFQAPGFSYSGLYRAFAELTESGDRQLTIQDAAGKVQIAEPHSGQLAIGWSPSAELLAYTSPDPDSGARYGPMRLLDPVSGESQFLNSDETLAFFWSPNGRKIAYLVTSSFDREGVQVLAKPRQAKPMRKDETQQSNRRLDLLIVDIDSGENELILSFTPTEIFLRQFLPFFDQYALSHQLWSPESDALVLPMMIEGVPHIMNVPSDGRDALPVAAGVIGFWSHQ